MKESKMTKIFKYIDKTPKLRYKKLITFICSLNNRPYQSGYYGTVLTNLKYSGRIRVNKKGYYELTKLGKSLINTPYAKTEKEKEKEREKKQYYKIMREIKIDEQNYQNFLKMKKETHLVKYLDKFLQIKLMHLLIKLL